MDMITLAMAKRYFEQNKIWNKERTVIPLLAEQSVECTYNEDLGCPIYIGGEMTIEAKFAACTFDGVEYECPVVDGVFGNKGLFGEGEDEDTGEPFLCAASDGVLIVAAKEEGTHTIKIDAVEYIVTPIPGEYLTDALPCLRLTDVFSAEVSKQLDAEQCAVCDEAVERQTPLLVKICLHIDGGNPHDEVTCWLFERKGEVEGPNASFVRQEVTDYGYNMFRIQYDSYFGWQIRCYPHNFT